MQKSGVHSTGHLHAKVHVDAIMVLLIMAFKNVASGTLLAA
jgi:hypothetical protein